MSGPQAWINNCRQRDGLLSQVQPWSHARPSGGGWDWDTGSEPWGTRRSSGNGGGYNQKKEGRIGQADQKRQLPCGFSYFSRDRLKATPRTHTGTICCWLTPRWGNATTTTSAPGMLLNQRPWYESPTLPSATGEGELCFPAKGQK